MADIAEFEMIPKNEEMDGELDAFMKDFEVIPMSVLYEALPLQPKTPGYTKLACDAALACVPPKHIVTEAAGATLYVTSTVISAVSLGGWCVYATTKLAAKGTKQAAKYLQHLSDEQREQLKS